VTPPHFKTPIAVLCALILGAGAILGSCSEMDAQAPATPNFSGYWEHAAAHYLPAGDGPGPVVNMPGLSFLATNIWVGDYRNPILQPWASEAVRVRAVAELERGEPLWSQLQLCMPFGVPHALLLREPVQILQNPAMVLILYQHDSQARRIYLNESHPSDLQPSPYGHSVGHYEGDTLVVDTIALSLTGPMDYYGTPHTAALHVVERYRLSEENDALEVRFTVSDSGTFTSEWNGFQRYFPITLPGGLRENICAENIRTVNIRTGRDGEFPVPVDETPDF